MRNELKRCYPVVALHSVLVALVVAAALASETMAPSGAGTAGHWAARAAAAFTCVKREDS